ncbi:MAG: zinc-ribbon domain-containing protein, partial [Lachnospiraceae bacterium]|nr:zinc-ribbon domain-containing protein [Lachnospiraceae bacterium]
MSVPKEIRPRSRTGLKVSDIPHMLKMWDSERNTENPEDVSANLTEARSWRCPVCGYRWEVSPKSRYKGSGLCPCHEANKAIMPGVNDVLTVVSGLSALLDDNNDFGAIATQGTDSSMRVNYFCCECGRKWTASIRSQVRKDGAGGYTAAGCPHYNTTRRKKEDVPACSDAEAIFRFWDDKNTADPFSTPSNSEEPAHFICRSCGYDWTVSIRSQSRGTGKCACCELNLVIRRGVNDLFTLVPESEQYYDPDANDGTDIYTIGIRDSRTSIGWKCPDCGNTWRSPISQRIKGKRGSYSFTGCQKCYLDPMNHIRSVASVPKLVRHWDHERNKDTDMATTSANNTEPVSWLCPDCGFCWTDPVKTYYKAAYDCPYCDGIQWAVYPGKNDLLTLCPEIASIYDFKTNEGRGIDIYSLTPSSTVEAHFACQKCGHEWDSAVSDRLRKKDGRYILVDCPVCSNRTFRSVPYSEQYPLLARMYDDSLNSVPLDSIRGGEAYFHTKYHWNCLQCGESFENYLNNMVLGYATSSHGCPYCSNTMVREGESFADLHPEAMSDYDGQNPVDPYTVAEWCKTVVRWHCPVCDHRWDASFALRSIGYGKCPVCTGSKAVPGVNSLKALFPDIAKRFSLKNERDADTLLPTLGLWYLWECDTCHGEYTAPVRDVVAGTD